jgi:BirA family biotin operon repressor/biotin-[acetyl-CoA-carboxylase] ligase
VTAQREAPAFHVQRHGRVGSTNDIARRLAEGGGAEGTLVVAAEQTGGRGRHGRRWHSPPGNFYASLLLRPDRPLAEVASLSLVIALVALEALEAVAGRRLDLALKWPNDLLLGGAKLAGILLEGAAGPDGRCAWVVAGLGVNLRARPPAAAYPTATLAAAGVEIGPDDFLDAYLAGLGRRLPAWRAGGFAAVRDAWLARATGLGREVTLQIGGELYRGRLADVGPDGSILVESPTGCLARYSAGELFFAEATGAGAFDRA